MRWSEGFIQTLREDPQEAEIASHKLLIRAGFIHKISSGLYIYLPLGLRVLEKISVIIREELGAKGAVELLMPALQPKEVWVESGRYGIMGELMMRVTDREQKEFILGPTHEEIITKLVSNRVRSYRDLPLNLYQIQTKFRDEIRPRFGLVRAKEFIMKDGYSFDVDEKASAVTYQKMYDAYSAIFKRCGLKSCVPVEADTGVMGGAASHEFMALTESGEDTIARCTSCGYAANAELAPRVPIDMSKTRAPSKEMPELVHTPEIKSVDDLCGFFNTTADRFIKTLIYTADSTPVGVLIRGDLEINEIKLAKYLKCADVWLADETVIRKVTGGPLGFSGPVGLAGIRIVADSSVSAMKDVFTGANKADYHLKHVEPGRDFEIKETADLGFACKGDTCLACGGVYEVSQGIELGQVFSLGTKYSKALGATYLDKEGRLNPCVMGCYGIGVSRTMQACVEENNDKDGIIWPFSIAPFSVMVIPLNVKSAAVNETALKIYEELSARGCDVLYDDRDERAGVKFKDADLIGIPVRVIIGERALNDGKIELSCRVGGGEKIRVKLNEAPEKVSEILKEGELFPSLK